MLLDRIIEPVVALPRAVKKAIVLSLDAGLCILTVWLAFYLRLNYWVALSDDGWPAALVSLIAIPIFVVSGLYRTVFRYINWEALTAIGQAIFIYGIIYSAIFTAFGIDGVPRTVGIIQPILLLLAVASVRMFGRYMLGGDLRRRMRRREKKNVLIYGAGSAGRQLEAAFRESGETRIVGFIDSARDLQGSLIGGVRVWSPEQMGKVIEELDVSEVHLAIPSAPRQRRNEILERIRSFGVGVRTLPGLLDIAHGKVTVSDVRPLEVDDLLGRDAVAPDEQLLSLAIRDKVVLITGAGGSIGSELCRQVLALRPRRLLLLDASEFALYAVHRELSRIESSAKPPATELVPLLGSVCDEARVRSIFATWRPHTVYHAAAYKHVPLVEHNPAEGLRNNVFGTFVCAAAARDHQAERFVLISTDKAVRPTNVMGATKRLAEMLLQGMAAERPGTRFSMVRFGNVLGSSGSVVPLFRQQIQTGGPVTVTHREITRYFMTIPEAAQLVIQAGAMAKGGEVFVLEMGEPVKVLDLAKRMISLSGLKVRDDANPDGDIDIVFTGLRPGEKLYEELLIGNDPAATGHPRILMASEKFLPLPQLLDELGPIREAIARGDVERLRARLIELVPEYTPESDVVDWVYVARQEQDAAETAAAAAPPGPRLAYYNEARP
jgi:FlaA1/EpsC-like NDP-sugar epimerase